ncbi:MAG: phospholipid carrier-dependent glycosyltransferase [Thermoguttaceae bacterium]|nr:phospholipid carrier-dependent glycosyltransferase [Thermoguttaceae bacterium]
MTAKGPDFSTEPLGAGPAPRGRSVLLAGIAAAVCWGALMSTAPRLPMGWDEGSAILRAQSAGWPYTTVREGHPAFYGLVIAAGRFVSASWLAPLAAARLGPVTLFSIAAGAMCYRVAREFSFRAAWVAVAALVLQPRLFAHAHFASIDGPLVSCWLLAWATFAPARRDWRWSIVWGIVLGMTLSTKATGWIAPVGFVVWAAVYRDRPSLRALAIGVPLALATFWALNPPLWRDPMEGFFTFLRLNLGRANQPGLNISTQFFGRMYNLEHPLPWYNTLVWTGITVPLGILVLFVLGLGRVARRWRTDQPGMLVAVHWAVLLVVRALPWAPPHDAERLILPSFAFLAALAGIGAAARRHSGPSRGSTTVRQVLAVASVLLCLAASGFSLLWYAPQWLSYYNLAIGGLPGATSAGMEPTYYWDALDEEVVTWLNTHTRPGEKVVFAAGPVENLALMRRWGILRCEYRARAKGVPRWRVVQHRPSAWTPEDRRLMEQEKAAFVKAIRRTGWGPWRLDVPLVGVYAIQNE